MTSDFQLQLAVHLCCARLHAWHHIVSAAIVPITPYEPIIYYDLFTNHMAPIEPSEQFTDKSKNTT